MCTGGACHGLHPIPSEGIGKHRESRGAFQGQEGSYEGGFLARTGAVPAREGVQEGSRKGGSYQEGVEQGCRKGLGTGSQGGSCPKKVDPLYPTRGRDSSYTLILTPKTPPISVVRYFSGALPCHFRGVPRPPFLGCTPTCTMAVYHREPRTRCPLPCSGIPRSTHYLMLPTMCLYIQRNKLSLPPSVPRCTKGDPLPTKPRIVVMCCK